MTAPATPRPAATLLLLRDDPFEVLMVRRAAGGSFPSASVFPGGTVDAGDASEEWLPLVTGAQGLRAEERALRIAALRECFEEVGILVATDADGRAVAPAPCEARDFRALVTAGGGRLRLDALVPFGRWITPEIAPRRWDTHFFLCRAPADQVAVCDDVETMAPEWLRPGQALEIAAAGTREIVFPTRMNLKRLAESTDSAAALAAAKARAPFTVMPLVEKREEGIVTRIPIEAGYGVTEFLHRASGVG